MNYNKAEFSAAYGTFSQLPPCERIEIAFARVSSVPGKTATINFYGLENVYFVDLPGYGYAKIAKSEKRRWSELIEGYLNSDRDIRLIFQLIDMRHAPSADDIHMINYLVEAQLPFIIILTKADKLKKMQRIERMEAFKTEIPYFNDIHIIPFSSQTFEGVEEVRSIIEEIASEDSEEI